MATASGTHSGASDKAFEVFVSRAIQGIAKEAWGRGREQAELKAACTQFLTSLDEHTRGISKFEGSIAVAVLQPLALACASSNPKVVEQALGCLHKLVAHAWLHGESSASEGLLAEESDTVSQVIKLVIRIGACCCRRCRMVPRCVAEHAAGGSHQPLLPRRRYSKRGPAAGCHPCSPDLHHS